MDIPETRYAMTEDGVSIAYSTFGEGAVDLVVDPSDTVGNIEMLWEFEPVADLYRRLAGFSRVILHDRRGCGLSGSSGRLPDLETRARDLLAVLDACGAGQPALFGSTTGGAALAMFAATYPDRALALAWYGPMARTSWTPEYPWGDPAEEQERSIDDARDLWGTVEWPRRMLELNAPDFATDESLVAELARVERHFVAPSTAMELERTWYETDVSHVLGALRCPVLLLDRPGSPFDYAEVEYVASLIPVDEVRPLPGEAFQMYLGDRASVAEAVREFLGIDRTPTVPESMLTTVLFTDIVGSTQRAAELGDLAWKELLGAHDRAANDEIERFRGRYVHTTGDGLLATFDGPARAVHCARAIIEAVRALGLEVRAGCHTGEVELAGDDIQGITVHVGARVAALAGQGDPRVINREGPDSGERPRVRGRRGA